MFDLNDFNSSKNMYIQASAGTGKTHTVKLIVSKLVCGDTANNIEPCSLDKILIVTYTEKAAGELRDRIRGRIAEVIKDKKLEKGAEELSEEQLEFFKKELENVDNAPIFTIHSFCQRTLDEFAFTARKPYKLSLIGSGEASDVINKWIRDVASKRADFQTIYGYAESKKKFIENQIIGDIQKALSDYYLDLEGNEVEEIVSLKNEYPVGDIVLESKDACKIAQAKSMKDLFLIQDFQKRYEALKNGSDKSRMLLEALEDNFANYHIIDFNGSTFRATQFKGEEESAAYSYFKDLKGYFKGGFSDYICASFKAQALQELYKEFEKYKEQKKAQTYDDMIKNIRENVIGKNSRLRKELQKKYRYAIIDEFQDTNQRQWDIFSSIFMEDNEHSIFVVGDPKQSIYSFQGADVNVYTKAINQLKEAGAVECTLDKNFRSTSAMVNACNAFFSAKNKENDNHFFMNNKDITFVPSNSEKERVLPPLYEGKEIEPLYFYDVAKEESRNCAWRIVEKIIDSCVPSEQDNTKTKLQIYDKDLGEYRNVTFKDFAILSRTGTELPDFEYALSRYGVPFSRYKDKELFLGSECTSWISLLSAIEAPDFTGSRRKILSEALFTIFFNNSQSNYAYLLALDDTKYDNPSCKERQAIIKWQQLAKEREWSKLIESIFLDTQVESRLSLFDKIQELSKLRQIGNYIVDYLYTNGCSINSVKKHLINLSQGAGDESETLIEKGTEFHCVQIMSIHASKGLESPIIICVGGLKQSIGKQYRATVARYHENGNQKLSFIKGDMDKEIKEERAEWERIFYVAYTRAISWMIIVHYVRQTIPSELKFLDSAFYNFIGDKNNEQYYELEEVNPDKKQELKKYSKLIPTVLALMNKTVKTSSCTESEQKKVLEDLTKAIPSKKSYKHSYTSLSNGAMEDLQELVTEDSSRINKEGEVSSQTSLKEYDTKGIQIPCSYQNVEYSAISEEYPKGKYLGIAVHEIFEKLDFVDAGCKASGEELDKDQEVSMLITSAFEAQALHIDEQDSKNWKKQTSYFVWNTMNAKFPEIVGGKETNNFFALKEINKSDRKAEVEFNLNPEETSLLKNYCSGFVDLIFKRTVNGTDVYSIIDWKSDYLKNETYFDESSFKGKIDDHYSIQRVLYSYCLIKWLKQFYNKTEEQIYNENFGGIYYVLFRGCQNGNGNGIYAHTWESWEDLEKAFIYIKHKLMKVRS